MTLSILDKLNEWIEPFKAWVIKNHGNPFMWLGFIILGLVVFTTTFSALHRNGD